MVVWDYSTNQYVEVSDPPIRIRVPFLNHQVGGGDAIAAATQALGVQPCQPCEERRRRMNQRVVFDSWKT